MAEFEDSNDDADIYSEGSRDDLVEDDEMTPEEDGFMDGFEKDQKTVCCAECKKLIIDPDDAVEAEIDNETYLFCSEECSTLFKQRHEGEE